MQENSSSGPGDTQDPEAPGAAAVAPQEVARPRASIMDGMSGIAVNIVFAMLAALITVVGYEYFLAPRTPQLATVDIMAIMETVDAPALKAIKEGNLEAAQKAAEDRARVAAQLEKVLDEMSKRKNMVFIQKQALIGSGVPDLTVEAMKLLGADE